jgi:hypothetical protein
VKKNCCSECGQELPSKASLFAEDEGPTDDLDIKSSVLDELLGLMDEHAGEKLKSVKKPKKSVSIEVLSLGKPKGDDFEEDEDEEEV